MNPDYYSGWRYEHLLTIQEQLEDILQEGEDCADVRHHLRAVNAEIPRRVCGLMAHWNGQVVREYGRWRSDKECYQQAKDMGLDVSRKFTVGGKPFETFIRHY
jgi:hypothetical protein